MHKYKVVAEIHEKGQILGWVCRVYGLLKVVTPSNYGMVYPYKLKWSNGQFYLYQSGNVIYGFKCNNGISLPVITLFEAKKMIINCVFENLHLYKYNSCTWVEEHFGNDNTRPVNYIYKDDFGSYKISYKGNYEVTNTFEKAKRIYSMYKADSSDIYQGVKENVKNY